MRDTLVIPLLFPLVFAGAATAWVAIIEGWLVKAKANKKKAWTSQDKARMERSWGLQLNSIVFTYFNLGIWYSFVRDESMWSYAGANDMTCMAMSCVLILVEAHFDSPRLWYSIGHFSVWGYFTLILCYKTYLLYTLKYELELRKIPKKTKKPT